MKHKLIFIFFAAVIIIYHIFGYIGHYGYDDLDYAQIAYNLKNGIIDYNNHFTFRTPVILLTALSYCLFGISDFSSSLPTIIISILILFFVFQILKTKNKRTLISGLSFTTLSNWFVFYSDKLMADMYIALAVIIVLYIIHQYRYKNPQQKSILFSFLLSLSLLLGFMSKGTIVLILPLLFYYFLVDVLQKKHIKFWIYGIIFGLVIFAIYFLTIKILTGHFLKRFNAIANNSYLNLCSYDKQSTMVLLKRISYQFFELLIFQGLATAFIFVSAYLFQKKKLQYFKIKDSFSFWFTSSIILLLSSNFMTISASTYSPMCLDPRHYLFLIPVVAIPAASILNEFIDTKNNKLPIIIATGIVCLCSFFLQNTSTKYMYSFLFLLLFVYAFSRINKQKKAVFTILFVLILSINPFSAIQYAQKIKYKEQKKIFTEQILNTNDTILVVTNEVQGRLGIYYNKFNENGLVSIIDYANFKYDSTDFRKKILFLNKYSRYLSGMDIQDLPYYAKNISSDNKLLYQNKELDIAVYLMNDFSMLQQTEHLLFSASNDFEKDSTNYWHQQTKNISKEVFFEGTAAGKVQEFSSTFELSTDSLALENVVQLTVFCKMYCNFPDKTKSKLVISIENEDGTYIWKGIEINKYLKAYSNWWQIRHEISFDKNKIKPHSKLKIYLWNIDKQEVYIDNFEVEIWGI